MLSILNNYNLVTAFPFIPIQITLVDLAIEGYTSFFISFEPNGKQIKRKILKKRIKKFIPIFCSYNNKYYSLIFLSSSFRYSRAEDDYINVLYDWIY